MMRRCENVSDKGTVLARGPTQRSLNDIFPLRLLGQSSINDIDLDIFSKDIAIVLLLDAKFRIQVIDELPRRHLFICALFGI